MRGRSVVNVAFGAQLDVRGGFANQPVPGSPYPTDGSNTGGSGAEGWVRVETPLGFSNTGIDVVPDPSIGTFSWFGNGLSSATSTPYSTKSADGSIHGHLQLQPALLELVSGTPAQLHILYEGFAVSDVSAGGRGPSLGIVSDPALLVDPQSVVMRYYLFENPAVPAATPWIDSVTVPFDGAP